MYIADLFSLLEILALGVTAFFFNVLLHELGHAIPVLCWSKQKVTVFVGSLGDPERSIRCRIGRLELFLKYNPFLWRRGLCRPGEVLPLRKRIIYTAMGPVISLLITLTCWLLLVYAAPERTTTIILVTVMVIGGMFTLSSALPIGKLSSGHAGKIVYNDATQIVQLWRTRNMPHEYWEAINLVRAKEYAESARLLEQVISEGHSNAALLRLCAGVQLQSGNDRRGEELLDLVREKYGFSTDDYLNLGYCKIMQGRYKDAIECNKKVVEKHFNHFLAMNNIAYSLIALDRSSEALNYLERGIFLSPTFAHLYCNRGWARMMLGEWEEGLADVQHALQLDDTLADGYRNLGIYSLEKGRLEEARDYLIKAKAMDSRVQFVDKYLIESERRLRNQE